jgi:hypothetical protein
MGRTLLSLSLAFLVLTALAAPAAARGVQRMF